MGFFSWMTQDTDKSIANNYSGRDTFPVDMIDDKGNVYHEDSYEGYGVFGGKDYFVLLAEMNGLTRDESIENEEKREDELRSRGINLSFKDNPSGVHGPNVLYPNLVESAEGWPYDAKGPESCPDQGYFYGDEEDEYDEEEELQEED